MARALDDTAYRGLKTATRRLVDATGGIDPAAASTRVGRATMAQYYSPADRDEAVFVPLDVIADLERVTGEPLVTRQLARLSGFDLVPAEAPLPATDTATAGNPVQDSLLLGASLSVRVGEYQQVAIAAAADGKLSDAELAAEVAAAHAILQAAQNGYDTLLRLQQDRRALAVLRAAQGTAGGGA
ncbi:hypothetical protein [Oceanibaculum nanhaiense]|uniref:hypothetical protein n=1 Tax=Oceanibaculum nanhaiense TaxID=1909734 RepID=UPI003D2B23C1